MASARSRRAFNGLMMPGLPRRTVRLRLTLLYGSLFLACGAAVLTITYLLVEHALAGNYTAQSGGGALGVAGTGSSQPPRGRQLHVTAGDKSLTPAQAVVLGQRLRQLASQQRTHELHQLLVGCAVALAVMTVAAVALGWLVAGRVLRPLRTITDTTRRISERNLHERLALSGPDDELKSLGDTIDALLARLEEAFQAQRRFVANASHELRTPLTMMRTAIDVATGKPGPPRPGVDALAARIELGLDKADQLVSGFLALAQAQNDPAGPRERVALDDVVNKVIAERCAFIGAAELAIDQDAEPAVVGGSELLVTHLVANLVDNAIRHNVRKGWIKLSVAVEPEHAVLTVENGGTQLDQREVDKLTQPFRRLAPDRTNASGFGLGLSIVAAIVANHGGTLQLHARPGGGLRVVARLARVTELEPVAFSGCHA
jgi:signal transduction histidine kinase